MLHWAEGAEGRGVVCSADIATVNLDRKSFTFMRSYPEQYPPVGEGRAGHRGGARTVSSSTGSTAISSIG